MTPDELACLAVKLLWMTEYQAAATLARLTAEDRADVERISADTAQRCRDLASATGQSYDRALAAVTSVTESW